jgi:hypothetical protein
VTGFRQSRDVRGPEAAKSKSRWVKPTEFLISRSARRAAARIMKGCPCWVRVIPGEWNET